MQVRYVGKDQRDLVVDGDLIDASDWVDVPADVAKGLKDQTDWETRTSPAKRTKDKE